MESKLVVGKPGWRGRKARLETDQAGMSDSLIILWIGTDWDGLDGWMDGRMEGWRDGQRAPPPLTYGPDGWMSALMRPAS